MIDMNRYNAAVFLDRDGTLMEEVDYCSDPEKVCLIEGTSDALGRLKKAGFLNVIVTNQSGIGRGYFTEEQYCAVHQELLRQIGPGLIDAAYHCPDTPELASQRRKPAPGMLLEAARELHIDLSRSFVIGDKTSDVECGRNAGVRTVLVQTGYGKDQAGCSPDALVRDINAAVEFILSTL